MNIWIIIILIICIPIYAISIYGVYDSYKTTKKRGRNSDLSWDTILMIIISPLYLLWIPIALLWEFSYDYFQRVKEHGGFKEYKEWKKQEEIEREKRIIESQKKQEEYERVKVAYMNGEIKREDLPRVEDGKNTFEFKDEMGLAVDYYSNVREIVYVENGYSESLNRFFLEHRDLRLYNMYKFVYFPNFCDDLQNDGMLQYLYPELSDGKKPSVDLKSDYPLSFLWHPEEAANIKHGMMFFIGNKDNHGSKYIKGHYYPLEEGSDDSIIAQLDAIVKQVHSDYSEGGLYCKEERPKIEEGSSDGFADELFSWELYDDEVAIIIEDVRKKIKRLKEKGLAENLLMRIIKERPKLSRLVITKEMRIILPDYLNMEIEMQPINKAVYLLFLKHQEGIVFKCLPDYRQELADIYQKIKPLGLNERAIQSIEDVTNPCLNSINEKCARIRGAFISKFDEQLAENYYITGERGEAKKITLPRDLVVWE